MTMYRVVQETHWVLKQCYSIILDPSFMKIYNAKPSYFSSPRAETVPNQPIFFQECVTIFNSSQFPKLLVCWSMI